MREASEETGIHIQKCDGIVSTEIKPNLNIEQFNPDKYRQRTSFHNHTNARVEKYPTACTNW